MAARAGLAGCRAGRCGQRQGRAWVRVRAASTCRGLRLRAQLLAPTRMISRTLSVSGSSEWLRYREWCHHCAPPSCRSAQGGHAREWLVAGACNPAACQQRAASSEVLSSARASGWQLAGRRRRRVRLRPLGFASSVLLGEPGLCTADPSGCTSLVRGHTAPALSEGHPGRRSAVSPAAPRSTGGAGRRGCQCAPPNCSTVATHVHSHNH